MLIISAYIYVEVFEKAASPSVRGRGVLGCKHRLGKHVVISLCVKKGKEALLLQSCADNRERLWKSIRRNPSHGGSSVV